MVTKAELLARRGIQDVVRARVLQQQEAERLKQIQAQRKKIEEQQKEYEEQQAEYKRLTTRPGTYDVYTIDKGGGKSPKTLMVVRTFPTREEAEKFAKEERIEFADSETPVGIRETPSIAEQQATTMHYGAEVVGPPKSERGLELQRRRQELEKIQEKVRVTDGQIDTSQLSSAELARIRQITGKPPSEAFKVQEPKPATTEEYQKSIFLKQKVLETLGKIEPEVPKYIQELAERTLKEYPETKKIILESGGVKYEYIPTTMPYYEPTPQGTIEKIKLPQEGVGGEFAKLFPRSPLFVLAATQKAKEIKEHPVKEIGKLVGIGTLLALLPAPASVVVGGALGSELVFAKPYERQRILGSLAVETPFLAAGGAITGIGKVAILKAKEFSITEALKKEFPSYPEPIGLSRRLTTRVLAEEMPRVTSREIMKSNLLESTKEQIQRGELSLQLAGKELKGVEITGGMEKGKLAVREVKPIFESFVEEPSRLKQTEAVRVQYALEIEQGLSEQLGLGKKRLPLRTLEMQEAEIPRPKATQPMEIRGATYLYRQEAMRISMPRIEEFKAAKGEYIIGPESFRGKAYFEPVELAKTKEMTLTKPKSAKQPIPREKIGFEPKLLELEGYEAEQPLIFKTKKFFEILIRKKPIEEIQLGQIITGKAGERFSPYGILEPKGKIRKIIRQDTMITKPKVHRVKIREDIGVRYSPVALAELGRFKEIPLVTKKPKSSKPLFYLEKPKPFIQDVTPSIILRTLGKEKPSLLETTARLKALFEFEKRGGILKIPTKKGFDIVDIKAGKTLIGVEKSRILEFEQLKKFELAKKIRGQPFKKKAQIRRELKQGGFKEIDLGQGQVAVQILEKPKVKGKETTITKKKARPEEFFKKSDESVNIAAKPREGIFIFEKAKLKSELLSRGKAGIIPLIAQMQERAERLRQQTRQEINLLQEQKPIQIQKAAQESALASRQNIMLASVQEAAQESALASRQEVAQEAMQETTLLPKLKARLDFISKPRKKIPPPPKTPPPKKFDFGGFGEREEKLIQQQAPSYDVQIRRGEKRGSKFITIDKNLPKYKALRKLKDTLDNYIEASGRLRPNKKRPRVMDDFSQPDMSKFRPPKKSSKLPKNTIIEKQQHRLDTLNEQRQISYYRSKAAPLKGRLQQKRQGFVQERQKNSNFFASAKSNNSFLGKTSKSKGGFLKNDFF